MEMTYLHLAIDIATYILLPLAIAVALVPAFETKIRERFFPKEEPILWFYNWELMWMKGPPPWPYINAVYKLVKACPYCNKSTTFTIFTYKDRNKWILGEEKRPKLFLYKNCENCYKHVHFREKEWTSQLFH